MQVWLLVIGGSAIAGLLTALLIRKSWAVYAAGAIPWFGLLAFILYEEYFTPYEGGGASMWPITQLFGGTVAATIGIITFKTTHYFRNQDF